MKILVLKPFLFAKTNGGEISLWEHLELFIEQDWEVQVHCLIAEEHYSAAVKMLEEFETPLLDAKNYRLGQVPVEIHLKSNINPHEPGHQKAYETVFFNILKEQEPDLCWVHYTDFFAVSSAVMWSPAKAWVRQTDDEYPRKKTLKEFRDLYKSYCEIQNFLVASPYMKESVEKAYAETNVVQLSNPMLNIREQAKPESEDYFLFVNPVEVKGRDFMLDLAKALPEEKFVFVGNWHGEMPEKLSPNIECRQRVSDIREVLSKAKLLLVPSKWQEAFGRLPLEAMSSGVPVITSRRGNLPDTVGTGGQAIALEISDWVDAINKMESDASKWREKGYQRVKEYLMQASKERESYLSMI